ncbi:alanine racemase [Pararhodobacter sp. CCB-MM2]|uniref:alanine racemase n=1 Tax=Pararhodobacter sp. CCB-MM2 TaxID=1786003 RepID=UPI0008335104|nr:alanine racemase [Pararhodobacter sp. CCB-MM2]
MITRPNHVEVDPGAISHNLRVLRGLLPAGREIWQVCKGDGYGLGVVRAAQMGAACGLTRFCAGTPDEALPLRAALPEAQILLFPSALPADLPALAQAGILLSVHNLASLHTVLNAVPHARFWLKLDCGLHRYGFDNSWLGRVVSALEQGHLPGLEGVYTHFSQSADPGHSDAALAVFDQHLARLRKACGRALPAMVAASPLLLARPDLPYELVDPGRALYGMMQPPSGTRLRPVVKALRSVLLDSRTVDGSSPLGYGAETDNGPKRVGTIPLGHFDGLPARPPFGKVLIRGRPANVLARTLLASMVDLSAHPDAEDGDPVTLVGTDEGQSLTMADLADDLGLSVTELHFGLVRALPKVVTDADPRAGCPSPKV